MTISLRSASLLTALTLSGCVARGAFQAQTGVTTGGPPPGEEVVFVPGEPGEHRPPPGSMGPGAPGAPVPAVSRGTQLDDFSFALKEYTGSYAKAFVAQKLTRFDVAPACMAKMVADSSSALHSASFYTADILEYAKEITSDDWSRIETQNNNDKENNKKLIEPMIESFRSRFHLTIAIEGDDCQVSHGALWLRYWTTIGTAINNYPPKSGTAIVTLNVTPQARDVTVEIDPTGTQFTITAPRDIEPASWSEKIEKPFRRNARSL